MYKGYFSFFFLIHFLSCFAQNSEKPRDTLEIWENIHLHLNKTTFLQGESLWFKAYVREQKSKLPSLATTNLHVALYDKKGQQIKRKLIYLENGMGQGDFAIDSSLTDTDYTLLAWTNYMQNFQKLEPFRQNLNIVRDIDENDFRDTGTEISVYPEGGHLIANAYNQVGILIEDSLGQGVSLSNLELVDIEGNLVRSNIATNQFGMGKIGFMVEAGKRYFLQQKNMRKEFPEANATQFGLIADNNGKGEALIRLVASRALFKKNNGEHYSMAIYQDEFIRFEDIQINENEPIIALKRKEMPYGVLTAVLFDDDLKPIARRIFFNHRQNSKTIIHPEIEHCLSAFGDSLQVDLILPEEIKNNVNLSISSLPGESMAYQPDNSIVTSFLIHPYTNNKIQDHYFFESQDRKRRFELDKRLLIEGWGKYNWDSKKQQEAKQDFEMENGISFQGKVIDADLNKEKRVSLIAEFSENIQFEELNGAKSFSGNMVLFDGDSLMISLIGEKGKLRKPKVEVGFESSSNFDEYTRKWLNTVVHKMQVKEKEQIVDQTLNIGERTIVLEGVTLIENSLKPKKIEPSVTLDGVIIEGRIIGDAEIKRYNSVSSYLASLGYNRTYVRDFEGFLMETLLSPKSNRPVAVSGSLNIPLSRVSAIYFDVDKTKYVSIISRSQAYIAPEDRNKYIKFTIENGYAQPQEYFTPNYPDYSNSVFKNYGAIDWKANISVGSDIPTSVTIPLKNQNGVQLYIEGMGANGSLISTSNAIELHE